ncbi:hypothetical protein BDK51DRAFT_46113, partial [Blyttiomyces helicus]
MADEDPSIPAEARLAGRRRARLAARNALATTLLNKPTPNPPPLPTTTTSLPQPTHRLRLDPPAIVRNDHSQRFVDTAARPANFLRDSGVLE